MEKTRQLQIGTFNLQALFWEVHNLMKPIASVKKLSVTLSLSSDLPEYAIGYEKRLMQLLLNVVGNAVKFSKEGSVSIQEWEYINPLDIPKIFSKFAQNQSLAGGSGLGLAICKRFVNLMEGHIWIESEGLGKGTTAIFIVKLGIPGLSNELKLTLVPKLPANHIHTIFLGLKVLLVDDNRLQNYRFLLLFQHALGGFLDTELLRRDGKMKLTPYEIQNN
nr:ethylene receptor [Ipomoea batatas]